MIANTEATNLSPTLASSPRKNKWFMYATTLASSSSDVLHRSCCFLKKLIMLSTIAS